jgi:outer membrane protein
MLLGARSHANDLKQLYELALTRDTALQAAKFQRDAAVEARPQALSQWLPQVSATASAERERLLLEAPQVEGSSAAVDCVPSTANKERCHADTRALSLHLSQTLWSYQAFNQLKEASFRAAAGEAAFQGAQQALLLRVAVAYFAILSGADQLATNRNEREAFGSLLNQAQIREQTGVGPRSDVEQAQAFYDATEQTVIDVQNALDDANLAMTQIVGLRPERISPLREDIPFTTPQPASADEWVASARQDNFDLRAAQLNVEAASRDVAGQRARGLPTLSLTGTVADVTQDDLLGGNQNLDRVGIFFSWPLFQGGAVASAIRQARASYRQAQAEFETAQRNIERATRAAFRGVVTGVQRIAAARRAAQSGRAAVEACRRNVEFGTGTEFDLLNAQNNYYVAVRAYNQARYDYLTSVLTLKQQAGHLSERDLLGVDDLLVHAAP